MYRTFTLSEHLKGFWRKKYAQWLAKTFHCSRWKKPEKRKSLHQKNFVVIHKTLKAMQKNSHVAFDGHFYLPDDIMLLQYLRWMLFAVML